MPDTDITITQLKAAMQDFVDERDWQQFHNPKNLVASISIEAAELLELFQWLSEDRIEEKLNDMDFRCAIGDEVADVILYLLSFANRIELDISDAITAKLKKNRAKYPIESFKGSFVKLGPA